MLDIFMYTQWNFDESLNGRIKEGIFVLYADKTQGHTSYWNNTFRLFQPD